jgi:hypothetical protein
MVFRLLGMDGVGYSHVIKICWYTSNTLAHLRVCNSLQDTSQTLAVSTGSFTTYNTDVAGSVVKRTIFREAAPQFWRETLVKKVWFIHAQIWYSCLLLTNTIWILFILCTQKNKCFKISIQHGEAQCLFEEPHSCHSSLLLVPSVLLAHDSSRSACQIEYLEGSNWTVS